MYTRGEERGELMYLSKDLKKFGHKKAIQHENRGLL
jgi:hypothetical protein